MAPHSSTLAWKIPWTEEPGGLQSMGLLRVRHDWATSLSLFTFMHWRRKWQPTPVFLPGESQGRGSLVGCRLRGHTVGHDWSDLAAAAAAVSSLEKYLFKSFAHFSVVFFALLMLSCMSCLCILDINPLWVASFAKNILLLCWLTFHFVCFLCYAKSFRLN